MQSPDLFPTMLSRSGKAFRQIILMRELTTSHPVTPCWHWYDIDAAWRCNLNKQVSWEFLGTWEAAWSFLLYASFCYRFLSTWATGNRIRETPWLVYLLRKFNPIRCLWPLMWISTKLTRSSWNDHVFGIFRCSKQSFVELQNPQSLKVVWKGHPDFEENPDETNGSGWFRTVSGQIESKLVEWTWICPKAPETSGVPCTTI